MPIVRLSDEEDGAEGVADFLALSDEEMLARLRPPSPADVPGYRAIQAQAVELPPPPEEEPPPPPSVGPEAIRKLADSISAAPPMAMPGQQFDEEWRGARKADLLDQALSGVRRGAARMLGRQAGPQAPLGAEAALGRQRASDAAFKKARADEATQRQAASLADPASAESKFFRDQLQALDPALAGELGPQFERMSGAYLSKMFPIGEMVKRRMEAKARVEGEGRKREEQLSEEKRRAAEWDRQQKAERADWESRGPQRLREASAAGSARVAEATAAQIAKEDRERTDKLRELQIAGNVPGREMMDKEKPPRAADAKKVIDTDVATQTLKDHIANLRKLIKSQGKLSAALRSERILAALEGVHGAYRVMANLGVPSGKDAEMSERVARDPTSIENMIRDRGLDSLIELEGMADRIAGNTASIYGYGPRQPKQPQQASIPIGAMKEVRGRRFRKTGAGDDDWTEVTGG
jgi:hypothetical protein